MRIFLKLAIILVIIIQTNGSVLGQYGCELPISIPCLSPVETHMSIEGTYGDQDVCLYDDGYDYLSRVDPVQVDNFLQGVKTRATVIHLLPAVKNFSSPDFAFITPGIKQDTSVTLYHTMIDRLAELGSKPTWKVCDYYDHEDKQETPSLAVTFSCEENADNFLVLATSKKGAQLGDKVTVVQYDVKEDSLAFHYDLVLDIDVFLYEVNCRENCRRDRLKVRWSSVFDLPKE